MSKQEHYDNLRAIYNKSLLSKKQLSKELGVSEATIDRLRKDGQLKSKPVLGQIMFSLDEVARFLAE